MTFDDIYNAVEDLCADIIASTEPVEPTVVGLDPRCGPVLVGSDFIATCMPKQLDYYGGFEYITEGRMYGGFEYITEGRMSIGNMTIYFAEGNTRVQDILDQLS